MFQCVALLMKQNPFIGFIPIMRWISMTDTGRVAQLVRDNRCVSHVLKLQRVAQSLRFCKNVSSDIAHDNECNNEIVSLHRFIANLDCETDRDMRATPARHQTYSA